MRTVLFSTAVINDNNAGKPEGIHLMIGRRPVAAFGNSTGDRQMLEYTKAGDGARLHDDAEREYAYGPAEGLPDTKVGTFPQDLYNEEGRLDHYQHEERLEAHIQLGAIAGNLGKEGSLWTTP